MNRSPQRVIHGLLISVLVSGCSLVTTVPEQAPLTTIDPAAPRLSAIDSQHFFLSEDRTLVGAPQVVFTRHEHTLSDIAREYNLGFDEVRAANPSVDPWLPGEEQPVVLPTQFILPRGPRDGLVLNLASMRIFFFHDSESGRQVVTHPIGIGRVGWETPVGSTAVVSKARDPTWYPPRSVRKEHAEMGDPLPAVVGPGPDNPLGRFAMKLDMPGYLIHGTNQPYGVGMRVSHGCIRLYPENIEVVFEQVAIGTKVEIVNQPVLAAWNDDMLFLEAHPALDEDERDQNVEAQAIIEATMSAQGQPMTTIDQDLVTQVLSERRGIPFPVSRFGPAPDAYIASAQPVENTAPILTAEADSLEEQQALAAEAAVNAIDSL
jgi:L,D-transpeptidase ErfK/SrfK